MSRPSPAEAADLNFVAHASWLQRRHAGMTVFDEPHLVVVDSGLPCDTFNFVCRARLDSDRARDRARWALAYFQNAQRPFSWWVGPSDRPSDLHDVLSAVGLVPSETELAMAADLSGLRRGSTASELHVERVKSVESLRAFAAVSAANWTPPDLQVIRFYEITSAAILSDESPLWLYLGSVGDTPVATAEMTVAGGVVGLYNISTRASYRRRGFGTAMTVAPLLDARERGYDTAVLQASRDGVAIYERVGFRPFGEVTEFKPAQAGR
jgi:ribosomal protein S18 acetylase RimI-like enzyme